MGTPFRYEHDFPDVPLDVFERYLNHPELSVMLSTLPGFKSRELVETKDLGNGEKIWRFKLVIASQLPSALEKAVPLELFTLWEENHYFPKEKTIRWKYEPMSAKVREKLTCIGTWKHTATADGKSTRRVIEGDLKINIMFVGGLAEKFVVGELSKNYEVEPALQRKFYLEMMKREKA